MKFVGSSCYSIEIGEVHNLGFIGQVFKGFSCSVFLMLLAASLSSFSVFNLKTVIIYKMVWWLSQSGKTLIRTSKSPSLDFLMVFIAGRCAGKACPFSRNLSWLLNVDDPVFAGNDPGCWQYRSFEKEPLILLIESHTLMGLFPVQRLSERIIFLIWN